MTRGITTMTHIMTAAALGIVHFGRSGLLRVVSMVSVAFVIRPGGALWRILGTLSQLIFSMRECFSSITTPIMW